MKKEWLFGCILVLVACSSCVMPKDLTNFQNPDYDQLLSMTEAIDDRILPVIQPDDNLYIRVNSFEREAADPFNLNIGGNRGGGMNNQNNMNFALQLNGYLVDTAGFINFPVVGKVKLAGLTLQEAGDTMTTLVRPYLSDAAVNVRFLNFQYFVFGEISSPGAYSIQDNRITLLEAVAQANDMQSYANRTNILVIRERNGERIHGRLNLADGDIFESPFFWLQQNDVIYVEPLKARRVTVRDPLQQAITYASALLGLTALVLSLTRSF